MNTKKILSTLLIAIIGGLIVVAAFAVFNTFDKRVITIEQSPLATLANLPSSGNSTGTVDFVNAAQHSVNAVVHVKTQYQQEIGATSIYDFFYGNYRYQAPQTIHSTGSGVIISDDGYVVTNNHVIEQSEQIEVVLNDKRSYKAELVGADPKTDIALLKIEERGLPFLSYGNSDNIQVGEWVLAVGNPFNLTSTVTAGIISAKARNINILSPFAIESFIQTDAAVNPGNSGGALVNTIGELVGINTAIASNTGSFTGYSFAIPVNVVKKIIADIIEYGEVQRAYLGIYPVDITAELVKELHLITIEGVYVSGVKKGGAAEDAGIQTGDIVTHIGAFRVNNVAALQEQVSKYRPGDKIKVSILRNDDSKNLTITLRNNLGNTEIINTETLVIMGAKLSEISNEEKSRLRLNNGVKISSLNDGKLKTVGIKNGFIITHINREPIYHCDDAHAILNSIDGGVLIEGLYPNGIAAYYTFET